MSEKLNPKHVAEAKSIGLKMLRKADTRGRAVYLGKCGHKNEYSIGHVGKGVAACRPCIRLKYEKEAKDAGLRQNGNPS
jgi:hypothetical protein